LFRFNWFDQRSICYSGPEGLSMILFNFEWSGRTNQDEKFTHKVLSSNPVKVQICDQRSICVGFEPHSLHQIL
jgi:hypothetical protein